MPVYVPMNGIRKKENVYIYNGILTINKTEIFIHVRKWTEIKNIIFDDRKVTQKDTRNYHLPMRPKK